MTLANFFCLVFFFLFLLGDWLSYFFIYWLFSHIDILGDSIN